MIHNNTSHRGRNIALAVVAAILPVLLAGACSTKYTSERDGKALGEALCDLKDAEDADERQSALDDIDSELENHENEYAFYTSEDREQFQSNLESFESNVEAGTCPPCSRTSRRSTAAQRTSPPTPVR